MVTLKWLNCLLGNCFFGFGWFADSTYWLNNQPIAALATFRNLVHWYHYWTDSSEKEMVYTLFNHAFCNICYISLIFGVLGENTADIDMQTHSHTNTHLLHANALSMRPHPVKIQGHTSFALAWTQFHTEMHTIADVFLFQSMTQRMLGHLFLCCDFFFLLQQDSVLGYSSTFTVA